MQTIQLSKFNGAASYAHVFARLAKKHPVNKQQHLDTLFTVAVSVVMFSFILCLFSAFLPFSSALVHKSRSTDETLLQAFHSAQAEHALAEFVSSIDSARANEHPELLSQACEEIKSGAVFAKKVSNQTAIKITDARVFTDDVSGRPGIQTTYSIQGKDYTSRAIF